MTCARSLVGSAGAAGLLVLAGIGLTGCAHSAASEPSLNPLEGMVSSRAERKAIADCLTDRGWPVDYRDGQILIQIDPAQDDAYDRDTAACTEEFGIDLDDELGPAEWDRAYAWSSELADCLEEHGWQVPAKPSRQAFESTYDSDPWLPWSLIPDTDLRAAGEQCPTLFPAR